MDRETFDALTRRFAAIGSRRRLVAALLGAILVATDSASRGASGRQRKGKGNGKGKGQPAQVLVCHNEETFPVPPEAVRGILLDGGTRGACGTGGGTGAPNTLGRCVQETIQGRPACTCYRVEPPPLGPCRRVVGDCAQDSGICLPPHGRCECND
jgi:hypothetical protein